LTAKKSSGSQKKGNKCTDDKNCPFHGQKPLRGRVFTGTVVRAKIARSALVEWTWNRAVPKYERNEKRRTRVMAHNPSCINAAVGDKVRLQETRKISKTKCFVIIEKLGSDNASS